MEQGRSSAMSILKMLIVLVSLKYTWAATYTVGDAQGWNTGINYGNWAAKYTFKPSDVLVFTYSPSLHSVLEVSQSDYQNCKISAPIQAYTTGSDSITLNTTKSAQYFICGTPGHCANGMALQITISAATAASPPTQSPSPTPAPATAKPSSPSPSTTPSPPSITAPSPSTTITPPSDITPTLSSPPPPSPSSAPTTRASIIISITLALICFFLY